MTTPTISNVSGTITTGQTLTITGTNMMDEDKTNWDSFFTLHPNAYGFEGTSPADDFYCDLGPCYGVYDNTVKLMGTKSIKFHTSGAHSANLACYNAFSLNNTGDLWYRWYTRYNAYNNLWPNSHIKHLFPGGGGGTAESELIEPSHVSEGNALPTQWRIGMYAAQNQFDYVNIPSGQLQNNRWYLFEAHLTGTTIQLWMDNVQIYNNNSLPATVSQNYLRFGIVNECCNNDTNFDLSNWWDGLAVSSSRIYPSSTIEIANSSNYSTATKRYQEPIYLSDNSVQIKADLTNLGTGPYYLFITNNRQETSLPYSLSSTCPNVECSFQLNVI